MSRSTLLEVYKTKAVRALELHNSWGTGPVMWDFFYEKHCWDGEGWGQAIYGQGGATSFCRPYAIYMDPKNMHEIFAKLTDTSIPFHHRAGLFLTCDRVILRTEDLLKLAEPFALLAVETRGYCKPKFANHWETISQFISKKAKDHDPGMLGVALNCTSVSDVWDGYPDKKRISGTSDELFAASELALVPESQKKGEVTEG